MKKTKTVLLYLAFMLVFLTGLSAQRTTMSGSLQLTVPSGSTTYRIEVRGPQVFEEVASGSIIFSNLIPGEYYISIKPRRGRQSIERSVTVDQKERTIVFVSEQQRVSIRQEADINSQRILTDFHERPGTGGNDGRPSYIQPMTDTEFNRFLSTVQKASFDSDKLNVVSAVTVNPIALNTNQAATLMKTFRSDDERMKCFRMIDNAIVDPQNIYTLVEVFTFKSNKDNFYEYIRQRK